MRKFLAYSVLLLTLYSVVFAAAAALDVDGGTIQAFAHDVSIPAPAGTSLEAYKTAQGFRGTGEDGGQQAGVSGQVCVTNRGDQPTQGLAITDVVQARQGFGGYQPYLSRPVDVSGKPVLAPGETHCYPYRIEFEPLEGARYRNAAIVTITNHSGWLPGSNRCPGPEPCAFGPVPKAGFDLPEGPCARARLLPDKQRREPAAPGAAGTQRWRLENSGSCAWDGRYRVAFRGGDELGAARQLPLVGEGRQVEPGQELEVVVAFQAPEAGGEYQGEFHLLGPDGETVSIEDSPQGSLWLQVVVAAPEPAPTDAPGPQGTAAPTAAATRTAQPAPTGTPGTAPASTREPTPTLPPALTPTLASTPTAAPTLPTAPDSEPPPEGQTGCTRPAAYWLDHPQAWPAAALELGGRVYAQEQAVEILQQPAEPGSPYRLAQELIAARLNLESGADGRAIHSIIAEADEWLQEHPLDSDPPPHARDRAAALAESLEAFNLGQAGPRLCPDVKLQPTPTIAPELTSTPSPTPSPSPTAAEPAATGTASPAPALPAGTPSPSLPAPPTPAEPASPTPLPPTETGTASPTPVPPEENGTATPVPPTPTEPASPTPLPPSPTAEQTSEPAPGAGIDSFESSPAPTPTDLPPEETPTPDQAALASSPEPDFQPAGP